MKTSVHHIGYGIVEYEENFWTGKRAITVGGQRLLKKSKNLYTFQVEDRVLECRFKGSFLTGATLNVDGETIRLSPPCKWYEILCSVLICSFILVWGNVPALCEILPLVGGAIGGGISGVTACTNLLLMKQTKNVGLKLLIWLGMFLATVLICFLVAAFILTVFF